MRDKSSMIDADQIIYKKDEPNVKFCIRKTALVVPDHLDTYEKLMASCPDHMNSMQKQTYLRTGEHPEVEVIEDEIGRNLILRGFWQTLFNYFNGTTTTGNHMKISYLALGNSYKANDFQSTTLFSEYFREEPDEYFEDGAATFISTLYIPKTEGNPTTIDDTILSATSNTVTFTSSLPVIPDMTDFRVQVTTQNAVYEATVMSSDASGAPSVTLTLKDIEGGDNVVPSASFPVGDIPQNGDTIIGMIAEAGCIIGDDATAVINSGKPLNRKRVSILKNSTISLLLNFIITGASVD